MAYLAVGKNVSARMAKAQMAKNTSNMGRLLFGAAAGLWVSTEGIRTHGRKGGHPRPWDVVLANHLGYAALGQPRDPDDLSSTAHNLDNLFCVHA